MLLAETLGMTLKVVIDMYFGIRMLCDKLCCYCGTQAVFRKFALAFLPNFSDIQVMKFSREACLDILPSSRIYPQNVCSRYHVMLIYL